MQQHLIDMQHHEKCQPEKYMYMRYKCTVSETHIVSSLGKVVRGVMLHQERFVITNEGVPVMTEVKLLVGTT